MNSLISVVVPIYNKENELEKSVKSIICQTYTNIEIILVNDGSTDNTKKICYKLQKHDNRIKVINQNNEGVSVARNTGIEHSLGKYVMFVDPDDWLSLDIIEKLLNVDTEGTCDIIGCCAMVHINDKKIKNSFFRGQNGEIDKLRNIAQLYSNDYYKDADGYIDNGVVWGKLYRREFLIERKLKFDPKLRRLQDNVFNLYAFENANSFFYIDEPLYHYEFEHINSASRKYIEDMDRLFTYIAEEKVKFYRKYYKNNPLIETLLYKNLSNYLLNIITNKICHPDFKISKKKRINELERISETPPFARIFVENKIYLKNSLKRIILILLNKENYSLVYTLYRIGYRMRI